MSSSLSFYMLVKNSARYLNEILSRVASVADEIIIVDSGSEDASLEIAQSWGAKCYFRAFDDFKHQRTYALSLCQFSYVFFLDSDEIPDTALIQHLIQLKQTGFTADAYTLNREWIVLGRPVHCIYPIRSPDSPVRLINKDKVSFNDSNLVHEHCSGFTSCFSLLGKVSHQTFHSKTELRQKLDFYTDLAARNLIVQGKKVRWLNCVFNPIAAWYKWYWVEGGWRDGQLGITLANYAFFYTFLKYYKVLRAP